MTALWCIQTVLTVAEVFGAFWCVGQLSGARVSGYRKWILRAGAVLLCCLTVVQRTYVMYSRGWLIVSLLFCGILCLLCYRESRKAAMLVYAVYFETLYCLDLFWYIALSVFCADYDFLARQFHISFMRIVVYVLARLPMVFAVYFFYKSRRSVRFYSIVGGTIWVLVVGIEHFSLVICDEVFLPGLEEKALHGWRGMLPVYLLLLLVTGFYFAWQRYRVLYRQMQEQTSFYAARYQVQEEESRRKDFIYHDFRNHMIVLQKMISTGNYGQAQKYLEELTSAEADQESPRVKHPVIDYLLQAKITEAQKRNIVVSEVYEGELAELSTEEVSDWCALLGNLWDNAIESCERAGEGKEIFFTCKRRGSAVAVRMKNSCPPGSGAHRFQTSKRDGRMHGIGLKSIRFVAAKYEGEVRQSRRGGIFETTVTVIMQH